MSLSIMKFQPPITRQEQESASVRLKLVPMPPDVIHADGRRTIHFRTGFVDHKDYTRRDGYMIVEDGFDRYGWSAGHPESPLAPPRRGR